MRHARPEDLEGYEDMLAAIRKLDGLVERTPGSFYRRSAGFLHFHADAAGLFADIKEDGEFERYRATTKAEQRALVAKARRLTHP